FETVHIEGRQIIGPEIAERPDHAEVAARRYGNHSRRSGSGGVQREVAFRQVSMYTVHQGGPDVLAHARRRNTPPQIAGGDGHLIEGRPAKRKPGIVRGEIILLRPERRAATTSGKRRG